MSSSPSAAGRRAGYLLAAAINIGVWFALNVWPGWPGIGLLSEEWARVNALVTVSLLVTIAANVLYALHDPAWLRAAGGLVTDAVSLAAVILVWRVFPFTFTGGWSALARVVLVIALVGLAIDMLLQAGSLIRALVGAAVPPQAVPPADDNAALPLETERANLRGDALTEQRPSSDEARR